MKSTLRCVMNVAIGGRINLILILSKQISTNILKPNGRLMEWRTTNMIAYMGNALRNALHHQPAINLTWSTNDLFITQLAKKMHVHA